MAKTKQAGHLGLAGEKTTIEHLLQNGFTVLAKNFRIPGGEIDIIAEDKQTRIFVEVKTRQKKYFNTSEVITQKKQRLIARAALIFNSRFGWPREKNSRFDVALLETQKDELILHYIPNAFSIPMESCI